MAEDTSSLISYGTGQAYIEANARLIFLAMENGSALEVGKQFGLYKYYTTPGSVRSAVNRAYNMVLDNPGDYEIEMDIAKRIQEKVQARSFKRSPEVIKQRQEVQELDIRELITGNRNKATLLLRKKLNHLDKNPKALADISLRDLVGAVHILFDKGQIVAGMATEHIAVMTNIPENLPPEDAIKLITRMREQNELSKSKYE